MSINWGEWGTIGDTIGGLSNFVTMLTAIGAFCFAWSEVRRTREQHAAEVKAEAARAIWRSAAAYARDLVAVLRMLDDRSSFAFSQFHQHYMTSMLDFRNVAADGSLYFDGPVQKALVELATLAGEAAPLLDPKRAKQTNEAITEWAEKIWASANNVKQLLIPYATLTPPTR